MKERVNSQGNINMFTQAKFQETKKDPYTRSAIDQAVVPLCNNRITRSTITYKRGDILKIEVVV